MLEQVGKLRNGEIVLVTPTPDPVTEKNSTHGTESYSLINIFLPFRIGGIKCGIMLVSNGGRTFNSDMQRY